ncbi:hypothetical protein TWF696_008805 [Orbilia brochopaga]|uniref:Pre-mRNA-splicing factor n=1 Tax=Orbilia brochopaga TaxID=3140254 RepID=A0AAV9UKU9_9PEZI
MPKKLTDTRPEDDRPTLSDLRGGNVYSSAASANWLNRDGAKVRFSSNVVKDIYKALEQESFSQKSLLLLESLQYVEQYLWPNYNEDSPDELVISMAMISAAKRGENIRFWGIFESGPASFPSFFRRILILLLSTTLPIIPKTHLLAFVTSAFQSLDTPLVRKECAPLVSIGIWQNFHSEEAIENHLKELPHFKKAWKAATKRLTLADSKTRARLNFERSWLYLIILDFISVVYTDAQAPTPSTDDENDDSDHDNRGAIMYAERMIEFLTDLLSQLPTRRYVHGLLEDLQILPCIRLSQLYALRKNRSFRELVALLEHFYYFQDDSETEQDNSSSSLDLSYRKKLARLQKESLRVSKEKLMVLGLSNFASITQKEDLNSHLSVLDDVELRDLSRRLGFRQSYPKEVPCPIDRRFLLSSLLEAFSRRPTAADTVRTASLFPNEETLFEKPSTFKLDDYNGARSLALPKSNLQYLSTSDFLWRMFSLYKTESYFEIRRDLQETLRKLKPRQQNGTTVFGGNSKMAMRINRISILEVAPPLVGETFPAFVRAELDLPFDTVSADVKREWESLRPDDVVFLLGIRPRESKDASGLDANTTFSDGTKIQYLRCAEVLQAPGENRQRGGSFQTNDGRKLHINLDCRMYMADKKNSEVPSDVYESLNLIIRRKGVENNFKPILASIQALIQEPSNHLPRWFKDTFLGCGDPAEACFPNMKPIPESINFGHTFLSIQHLQETAKSHYFHINIPSGQLDPPFVFLNTRSTGVEDTQKVPTYDISKPKPSNPTPYLGQPNKHNNLVRYTNAQVEAIFLGTNPGLSLIIGPPGTGKTDVATQIICNLYHNFPNERTLLLAHSNQALNQLFLKISDRDIDERHLLRLGHGEEELQLNSYNSKYGRIESLMERRLKLLEEVDRLALSIQAPGAHGNSCETASYFNKVYIKPLWQSFRESVSLSPNADTIQSKFPFINYFSNTPQPVIPRNGTFDSMLQAAEGCYEHITGIFNQLNDIMPFELLRSARDKTSYLLSTEARVIAMTTTYAAIKRDEIIRQGFRYDNVVMEEAAQVTEIETFIPLTLQKNTAAGSPIKRIVLCGDHLQNAPVVQNTALRYFANLEQSLFARFVRLGIPATKLDKQGRARPSIASLYSWRYPGLGDLDYLNQQNEFLTANAGFRYDFQFINVEDFQGRGEQEPSPHFLQNLGEAEYAVALFQYMRLLGYPANKISILTSYSGQRALIYDILNHRCIKNPLFGSPAHVTTIDKFQGEQNDYIIVSLVRTSRVGYLRDLRRLTVALSRARFGLYILGRLKTFELCFELKDAFSRLLQRPTQLELVTGEMWPTSRQLSASSEVTVMESVEHLGKYVYEMTETKLASLNPKAIDASKLTKF